MNGSVSSEVRTFCIFICDACKTELNEQSIIALDVAVSATANEMVISKMPSNTRDAFSA